MQNVKLTTNKSDVSSFKTVVKEYYNLYKKQLSHTDTTPPVCFGPTDIQLVSRKLKSTWWSMNIIIKQVDQGVANFFTDFFLFQTSFLGPQLKAEFSYLQLLLFAKKQRYLSLQRTIKLFKFRIKKSKNLNIQKQVQVSSRLSFIC